MDDALVLLDAARDAAMFEGAPPALGTDSTEVRRVGGWAVGWLGVRWEERAARCYMLVLLL